VEYKIALDENGVKHFTDVCPNDIDYIQVVHRSPNDPYLIGFLPVEVIPEIRVGDRFHSLEMEYIIHAVDDYVYVEWIH